MEIEIRAKVDNLKELEEKIINLGATLVDKKNQIDKYFGEIILFKKLGYSFLMRVRDEGNKKFLTYKSAKSKRDGVWEEYELNIDDEITAETMLKAMGLEKIIEVEKNRIEYKLNGLTICLDTIKDLGNFIEIESLNDNDLNKDKLKKLMDELDIKENQIIHKGYVTMLLLKNNSLYSKYIVN